MTLAKLRICFVKITFEQLDVVKEFNDHISDGEALPQILSLELHLGMHIANLKKEIYFRFLLLLISDFDQLI